MAEPGGRHRPRGRKCLRRRVIQLRALQVLNPGADSACHEHLAVGQQGRGMEPPSGDQGSRRTEEPGNVQRDRCHRHRGRVCSARRHKMKNGGGRPGTGRRRVLDRPPCISTDVRLDDDAAPGGAFLDAPVQGEIRGAPIPVVPETGGMQEERFTHFEGGCRGCQGERVYRRTLVCPAQAASPAGQ